jgi:hypothetical protein
MVIHRVWCTARKSTVTDTTTVRILEMKRIWNPYWTRSVSKPVCNKKASFLSFARNIPFIVSKSGDTDWKVGREVYFFFPCRFCLLNFWLRETFWHSRWAQKHKLFLSVIFAYLFFFAIFTIIGIVQLLFIESCRISQECARRFSLWYCRSQTDRHDFSHKVYILCFIKYA